METGYYLVYRCGGTYGYTSPEPPLFDVTGKAVLFPTKRDARHVLKPILASMTRIAARRFAIVESRCAAGIRNA